MEEVRLDANLIRRAVAILDDAHAELGFSERETMLYRVGKLGEEFGEVWNAVIGAAGQNPRKGKTHEISDVADELVDVALTAIVALVTVDPESWTTRLQTTIKTKLSRLVPPEEVATC